MKWMGMILTILIVAMATGGSAHALTLTNGGFETGTFNGWMTTGNTSIQTAAFGTGPTEGTFQALMTTGGNTVTDGALDTFFGLAAGTLDSIVTQVGFDRATEGSGIKQTVTVAAGDTLSFDWNFLTGEETPSTDVNDSAFFVLQSGAFLLADTFSPGFGPSGNAAFIEETGYSTFTTGPLAAGTYILGFGVVDFGDELVDSGLLIDNVGGGGGGGPVPVPEPSTLLLLGCGIIGMAGLARKKMKQ